MPQQNGPHVAIVGAGFSGLLTAVNLLKASPQVRVTLIERRGVFGPGTAYDTGNPGHLLNVRLDNMSAFPDRPGHLADWLAEQPSWRAQDGFITRGVYGEYLRFLLDEALDDSPDRLNLIGAEARSTDRQDDGWHIGTTDGEVTADQVVLALGNLEPASPPGVEAEVRNSPAYVENPWRFDPQTVGEARNVLLIGSGLTMVDAALTLRRPGRRLTALSRHGLLPRAHATVPPGAYAGTFSGGPAQILKQVRAATAQADWRAVFDTLRHSARDIWRSWSQGERSRFLRHLRPLWDVHRHRLSPGSARDIHSMLAGGELTILAGKLTELKTTDVIEVSWRPRGKKRAIRDRFDLVVNCTGPLGVISKSTEPMIRDILDKGYGRPDPLGLGLQVDDDGGLLNGAGDPAQGLHAIGPLTRGAFWEMTAVPDLRGQARDLAHRILSDRS
ncbi:FAD-dependent oxidoreductase [Brevundimonas intermedia]|uniref:FAD-dependent oxidoreductase n=1 Tax=Brevundimonas intermedia TaxID=74315 RepID=A0A4Y9RTN4_9CAUL|nr:FAD/NAD(P)-binding protein [Brevundimonas intermedia]TFW12272.1 FAD-dependent oxidoreductase [Brevundimonas intermedia]